MLYIYIQSKGEAVLQLAKRSQFKNAFSITWLSCCSILHTNGRGGTISASAALDGSGTGQTKATPG
jgi:hypothetical protein